ncbi:MAG: hypothetical protein Q8P84_02000 [Deltaproteobacteria bacterium]|nr:hypothetical protein [Deltaproteobacteria bacterium]
MNKITFNNIEYAGFSSNEGTCEPVLASKKDEIKIDQFVSVAPASSIEIDPVHPGECFIAKMQLFLVGLLEMKIATCVILSPFAAIESKNSRWLLLGLFAPLLGKFLIHDMVSGWGFRDWGLRPLSTVAAYENMQEKCGGRGKLKATEKIEEPHPPTFTLPDLAPIKPEIAFPVTGLTLGAFLLLRSPTFVLANFFLAGSLLQTLNLKTDPI